MKKIIGISFVLAAVMLFSCQDEKIENQLENEGLTEKAAQITLNEAGVEGALTEMEYEIDFYANAIGLLFAQRGMGKMWGWSNKLRYNYQNCPQMDIEGEDYPKTITLDYGEGTELQNGKVLSGVIIIEITAPRQSLEHQRNVTYQDFGVDTLTINGTSVVMVDREEESFRTFTSDLVITFDNGLSVTRTSERMWQWIAGMDTELDQTDDMMEITGFARAETSDGDVYRKDIVEPLIRIRDCRFIVKGVVEITLNDELVSTMDYGDGTCDEMATITKGDEIVDVNLAGLKMNRNSQGNPNNGMATGTWRSKQNGNGNQQGGGNQGGNAAGSQDGSGSQNGKGGNGNRGGGMNG